MLGTRRAPFADRAEAGRELGEQLRRYAGRPDVVVLGLPRGGVPVAACVARCLAAPLDVLVVRKLGLPRQPELAMGAIAGAGDLVEVVRNDIVLSVANVADEEFDEVYRREAGELRRREQAYRGGRPAMPVRDRVVIVVDDGLATGSTMRAAVAAVRRGRPAACVVAVPVGARQTCVAMRPEVDDLVCAASPEPFFAVGQGYADFAATTDEEVRRLLRAAADAREEH